MKFRECATYIQKIEAESARLGITRILAELFHLLSPEETCQVIYLVQGLVSPKFNAINFGIAEKMMIRAIAAALQLEVKHVQSLVSTSGDIGSTVEKLKKEYPSITETSLSITEVFSSLHQIAIASGEGSQDHKIQLIAHLLQQSDPLSARYIVRIPLAQLRLGFSDMTILDALSWMMKGDKSLRPALQAAYHVRPDMGYIGKLLQSDGMTAVEKITPEVFTPIIMMRAERLSSGDEIIEKIGECLLEPKYDGFRLQVHKKGKEVKLFTRGLEDATFMYPDIVEGVRNEVTAKTAIFEGEAIGYDIQSRSFLPFQETSQRKRKYGITEKVAEIPLKLFSFDLLYCEGESFLRQPFKTRRQKLESTIHNSRNQDADTILVAPSHLVRDGKKIEMIFDEAITNGLEGVIAKKMTGFYEPGARGWNWIKFKKSYSSKIEDTIDCVVMGYDLGKGKRTAFGIGAFLVGVLDEEREMFVTFAKIGTGLTDDEWRELRSRCEKLQRKQMPVQYDVDKMMECDVWVEPQIVVEIKADEITRSPVHTAGRKLKPSKSGAAFEVDIPGYALRFPRLQRFRDDKTVNDATTLKEVQSISQISTTHS